MRTISSKIVVAIVACSLVIGVLVGSVSVLQSSKVINQGAVELINLQAKSIGTETDLLLNGAQSAVEGIVNSVFATVDEERLNDSEHMDSYHERLKKIVKKLVEGNEGILAGYLVMNPELTDKLYQAFYILDENNNFQAAAPLTLDEFDEQKEEMNWYYNPIRKGTGVWSDVYYEDYFETDVVSYTAPVYVEGKLIGVVGTDIRFNVFADPINSAKVYDTGYAFLLDDDFNMVVHKSYANTENLAEIEGGSFAWMIKEMKNEPTGVIEYDLNGDEKFLAYTRLSNNNILSVTVPHEEVTRDLSKLQWLLVVIVLSGVSLAALLGFLIARSISKPLHILQDQFEEAANGDLRVKVEISSKDEVRQVSDSFNTMIERTRGLVTKIGDVSASVNSSSQQLAKASLESSASTEEMSSSIDEVATRANQQSAAMEQANSRLRTMEGEIDSLSKMAVNVNQSAETTNQSARQGHEEINKVKSQMQQIHKAIEDASSVVGELVGKSTEIGNIVGIINRIANQTQLLALNAAIEAARAGQYGSGFAVVADEIKDLAEETVSSAAQISKLIKETQIEATKASSSMDLGRQEIVAGNEVVETTAGFFTQIVQAADDNLSYTESASANVEQVEKLSIEIAELISEVAAIAQETSASAEEVAASTEEQAATIEQVSASADTLNQMANALNALINEFKY